VGVRDGGEAKKEGFGFGTTNYIDRQLQVKYLYGL
jgi:hypothetical protein